QRPVIDEQADELGQDRTQELHWALLPAKAGLSPRIQRTIRKDEAASRAKIPSSAKSSPGHSAPRPSPIQNTPKLVSISPTANLRVFSGTWASGLCTASPIAITTIRAARAPKVA